MADYSFEDDFRGLDDTPKDEWPTVIVGEGEPAIEGLGPDTDAHKKLLHYLVSRIETSEREMSNFYARWSVNEMKLQGYVLLPEWEKELKAINETGAPPKVTSVVIPYSMAISSTIVTYLLHTFTGRRPMLQVGTYKGENIGGARSMETLLQFNADHTKLPAHLFNFFQDGQVYGMSAMRSLFKVEKARRTRRYKQPQYTVFGREMGSTTITEKVDATSYEGNEAFAQDPYMFFPDPNVPMTEVNSRGEFVFWRNFEGRHKLLKMQADGDLKWVDKANRSMPASKVTPGGATGESARALVSGGDAHPGMRGWARGLHRGSDYMQVDQGTCSVIPKELGLGPSERPEIWFFTILNKSQVVQAEKLDADHDLHPVVVSEPYSLGYGFGHPGIVDYIAPIQDVISWLVNSHIDNVRKVINDVLVYDPSAIEGQDLKNPEPGKLLRLKRAALGKDVRTVVQQLQVTDVTSNHIKDVELFIRFGQLLSAVSDNVLGIQDSGGRKTATEIRTSAEAAASRLASQARIISSQALVDLTKMWTLNLQQHLSDEFAFQVLGKEGQDNPIITPLDIQGDFHYPVHDGTLPIDKVAMMDVWKELFQIITSDQEMRGAYNVPEIFEYIAQLGGAQNIEAMRVHVTPDAVADDQVQAGNVVPIGEARASGPSPLINALGGQPPGNRLSGGL